MAASIPKTVADFETSLDQQAFEGDTSFILSSIVDVDGNNLAGGLYGFTLSGDEETYKEFCIGVLSGSTVSSVFSISAQNVATSGLQKYHRRGGLVSVTDWVALGRVTAAARGDAGYDAAAPLFYDANFVATGNQIPTAAWVLSVVNGGDVSYIQLLLTGQTAGENLTLNDRVYLATDGEWYKVDADLTSTFSGLKLGYALATQTSGNTLSIAIDGAVPGFVGLTQGSKYYSTNTAGAISTTPGTYTAYAGTALSSTVILADQYVRDIPTGDEKDALQGSQGVPTNENRYITEDNTSSASTDQSQLTANSTQIFGTASTTGLQNRLAQSFVPAKTKIRGVNLDKDANTGTFTGTVTVSIQSDSSGEPDGVALATVTLTNAQWLNLPVGVIEVLFAAEASLVVGTTYWIVAQTSTADTSNHPNLGANSAGGYASGSVKYYNATDDWVAIPTIDLYFATLEGDDSQVIGTNSSGFIPDAFYDKNTMGFNRTVGALASNFVKTYHNIQLPFILWAGAQLNDAATSFQNWIRSGATDVVVPGMGSFAKFQSTDASYIYLSDTDGPFWGADGAIITFAKSNVLVLDFNMALLTADDGVFLGFTDDGINSPQAAYNATADREVAFVFNGTDLYAKTANAAAATLTQIFGVTTTAFNNYRIEADLGADSANFYVNGILVATITATFPGTSGTVSVAFGRQDDAAFVVSAPNVAIEMNP